MCFKLGQLQITALLFCKVTPLGPWVEYVGLKEASSAAPGSALVVAPESTSPSPSGWMPAAMCYIVIDRFPGKLVSAYIPSLCSQRSAML